MYCKVFRGRGCLPAGATRRGTLLAGNGILPRALIPRQLKGQGEKVREMMDAGEIDLREGYERLFKVLGDANDKSRKKPRRQRLRRQLDQLPPDEREQLIDDYENAAFRNFKDIRWGLSWPSDSEGEEEDDNVGDDESEDDEPEDDEPEDDEPEDDGMEEDGRP
ncbi:MAG: hypothetical protein Q9207_000740 [Kuettlingeria erythrocarpa]